MENFIRALLVSLIAVFAPAKALILSTLALIVADLITGVMASRKQNIPITSSGVRRTVSKLVIYEVAILLAFIAQRYLLEDTIPVANIAAGMIGITELISCYENLNIISGNDMLKSIIDKLGSANKDSTKVEK